MPVMPVSCLDVYVLCKLFYKTCTSSARIGEEMGGMEIAGFIVELFNI